MSDTLLFLLWAGALTLLALALFLSPFWRQSKKNLDADRNALNLAILQDSLAELKTEYEGQRLSEADFQASRKDLERRLIEETKQATLPPAIANTRSPKTALALLLILPAAAISLYLALGTPSAIPPVHTMKDMLARFMAHLDQNPQDTEGWLTLAQVYQSLGRTEEAIKIFARISDQLQAPAPLVSYAELLAERANGAFKGEPEALIRRALKLDATYPHALLLAGVAAHQQNDFKNAIDYWEKLIPRMVPDSAEAKALLKAIDETKAALNKASPHQAPLEKPTPPKK